MFVFPTTAKKLSLPMEYARCELATRLDDMVSHINCSESGSNGLTFGYARVVDLIGFVVGLEPGVELTDEQAYRVKEILWMTDAHLARYFAPSNRPRCRTRRGLVNKAKWIQTEDYVDLVSRYLPGYAYKTQGQIAIELGQHEEYWRKRSAAARTDLGDFDEVMLRAGLQGARDEYYQQDLYPWDDEYPCCCECFESLHPHDAEGWCLNCTGLQIGEPERKPSKRWWTPDDEKAYQRKYKHIVG